MSRSSRAGSSRERYEHVVIATHSDQALAMLADPSARESALLGAIPYQRNEATLHTDSALLPRRRGARAAWNFHLLAEPKPVSTVTYYMNHLQRLRADRDFCVTLNRTRGDRSAEGDPHDLLRPPRVHARGCRRAAARTRRSAASRAHALLRRLLGLGLPRGRRRSALRACAPFGVSL